MRVRAHVSMQFESHLMTVAHSGLSKKLEFDPEHKRAYGELGLLTKLAELMGRSSPPVGGLWDFLYRQ